MSVDIVVGGQYGDEGKGMVAYQLALQHKYAAFVRTGGENAEHRIVDKDGREWCFHILPVASITDPRVPVYLPPGMTFSVDSLERELDTLGKSRGVSYWVPLVYVDPNCGIITRELIDEGEEAAYARGSTFLGVGATMASKVRRHGFKVARDYSELAAKLKPTTEALHSHLWKGEDILIEGSQGTLLSLDHGHYPYCTSRNVTATGALSDAGLNWRQVRDVWMVVKTVPTRVPGNSGPAHGRELTWLEVCQASGHPLREVRQTDTDTGAGGIERPFEISFEELSYASKLNGVTRIALTWLDWWDYDDFGVTCEDKLGYRSAELIRMVEAACNAPVALVRTGPKYEHHLWRRQGRRFEGLDHLVTDHANCRCV